MSLNIYIPRMLGTVTKKTIQDSFNALGIGRVDEIDMVYKVNENRNAYYFAFIKISPYNTPQSAALQTNLNKNKYIRFTYDEEAGQYWEIKKYIPRDQRGLHRDEALNANHLRSDSPRSITSFDAVNGTENKPVNPSNVWKKTMQEPMLGLFGITSTIWTPLMPIIDSITNAFTSKPTAFTAQDKLDLVEEYEDLEKQIRIEIFSI
jgi:hypothetical protein